MKKRLYKKKYQSYYADKWGSQGTYLKKQCEFCGSPLFYMDRFDSDCCPHCNQWAEEPCGDPDCPYCSMRPDTPAEGLILVKPKDMKAIYIKCHERRLMADRRQEKRMNLKHHNFYHTDESLDE